MGIRNAIAQYRNWKDGVVHTTLNPEGPGAVRIHLVPPRWKPLAKRPYVVLLNGTMVLPLGYSWAVLLKNFMETLNPYDGRPMTETDMDAVVHQAVISTHKTYKDVPLQTLAADLGEMISTLCEVARGRQTGEQAETCEGAASISLRNYAPYMAAPHRMDLMISSLQTPGGQWNCNLRCCNCYAAGQPAANAGELSTAEWKTVIERCRKAGIVQLTFTGGEPTMREDLPELVNSARWFVTRLNTNGIHLTPQLCAALKKAGLDSVQVTLYAADEQVHNRLVGANGWEKTVAGLRSALAAGLDLSVNTPLCKDNAAYEKTLEFLHGQGVRFVSCSGLIETGKAAGENSLAKRLTPAELETVLRKAAAFCAEKGMELSFTSPGQVSPAVLRECGLTVPGCGACLSNMAVAPDGAVMPCQSWLGREVSLGNLLHDPWKRIWNHPECRKIRGMDEQEALHCPLRRSAREEETL